MKKKYICYLNLLELKNSRIVEEKLRSYIQAEENVILTEQGEEALQLTGDIYIDFIGEIASEAKDFFSWWANAFKRRRQEKFDELTGVYTRSYWERKLKNNFLNAGNYSLAMADIDHFKRFNDLYGHQTGDRVLAAVGDTLKVMMPDSAHVVRYGGEEFLVIFPGFSLAEIKEILEEFRIYLETNRVYDDQPEQITMSIGLCTSINTNRAPDLLIRRADLALYEAKENGRNRLEIYAPHLNRQEAFYVWGIYRYFRGKNRRIFLGASNLLINVTDNLFIYSWRSNSARKIPSPREVSLPLSYAIPRDKGYMMVDNTGEIWQLEPGGNFQRISTSETPAIAKLIGEHDSIYGVGINNQLYQIDKEVHRQCSLPKNWQFLVATGGGKIFFIAGDRLVELSEESIDHCLPGHAEHVSSGSEGVYLTDNSGRGFRFDTEKKRWSKLDIVNLESNNIHGKKMLATGNRLLIRDRAGRLLLCRRSKKSVAQKMSIFPSK
ncbi:MAG: GGDEF domain-containing protein [bacterium]